MTPADAIHVAAPGPHAASAARAAWRRELLLLGAFYLLMHGGILLIPNAVFWDDWVLYRTAPQTIAEMFADAGAMFNAVTYMHMPLLALGMWSYKVLTFALWFASGLLLNRILARTQALPDGARFAIVLLFLVLPFNAARVAAINFPYTLTTFFFFLAWFLMDRRRVAALLLFAASFFTPSLLVFYALPMLDLAYRGGHLKGVAAMLRFAVRRLDFMLLPFAFYGLRVLTFRPSGTYTGYNSNYDLANVRSAINAQGLDALDLPLRVDLALAALLLPLAWLLLARTRPQLAADGRVGPVRLAAWLALGVLAFVLGGFPYWILGLVPTFMEWTSRHQLLLPLGTALVLVALVWMLPSRLRAGALAVLVAACLSLGIGNAYAFWVDAQKQRALAELIARDPAVARASFVIFQDRTSSLNAIERDYRFYEWNGLMEEVFGDQTRFGAGPVDARNYLAGQYDGFMQGQYKAAQHRRDAAAGALLVEITSSPVTADRLGTGLWRWPPLPQLALKTTQMSPDALQSFRRN